MEQSYVTTPADHKEKIMHDIIYHVDFNRPELCSGCDPISCSIKDNIIPFVGNWRDLLAAITEFCISNFPQKAENLKSTWFSNHRGTPYLLSQKPPLAGKKVSGGYWICVNYEISRLVSIIAKLCRYCGISLNDIEIAYTPKTYGKVNEQNLTTNNVDITVFTENEVRETFNVIDILRIDYANGFKFDTTTIRLLSEKSGNDIDEKMQAMLKNMMFQRTDNVYFLLDMIASAEVQKEITEFADSWLDDFGCFEISELYSLFNDNINSKCINMLEDFESFYEFINKRNVRCVAYYGTRIVRINKSVNDLSAEIAAKIITITHDEYSGTVDEDELSKRFPAFSLNLLTAIIKEHAEELVKTEINGIVCYQTLDALGLSDDFSETLFDVLEQIDRLGLIPSEEVLHTALSINLGVNFKSEYNIPDDRTYRRLIDAYYKNAPKRKWLKGIFAEEQN